MFPSVNAASMGVEDPLLRIRRCAETAKHSARRNTRRSLRQTPLHSRVCTAVPGVVTRQNCCVHSPIHYRPKLRLSSNSPNYQTALAFT